MQTSKSTKRAIFFDRDGVLTIPNYNKAEKKDYAVRDEKQLKLYQDCENVVKKARALGFLTFVFSNQPDIALGKIDEKRKIALESKFVELLEKKGLEFEEIRYCHHHEKSINSNYPQKCACRKPKPGMIIELGKKWNVDLEKSFVVGDTWRDILAGKNSGCRTILIKKLWSHEDKCSPDFVVEKFKQILDIIGK